MESRIQEERLHWEKEEEEELLYRVQWNVEYEMKRAGIGAHRRGKDAIALLGMMDQNEEERNELLGKIEEVEDDTPLTREEVELVG